MHGDWPDRVRDARRADFRASTVDVARSLVGAVLVHEVDGELLVGRIVETEAYLADCDPASHSHGGRTPRNASMFGEPGHAYVYLCYGVHVCFNVVTGREGIGEAVLVRALEPLAGLEAMSRRRGDRVDLGKLCSGPGRLTRALGIELAHDGRDLVRGALHLGFPRRPLASHAVAVGPRIGITKAVALPLRFVLAGSPWASRPERREAAVRTVEGGTVHGEDRVIGSSARSEPAILDPHACRTPPRRRCAAP